MKNYKTLLFDIDDTLLDFKATEQAALKKLFKEQKLELTAEIELHYQTINQAMWRAFERGEVTQKEVISNRFTEVFKAYGKEIDGAKVDQRYREFLAEGHHLIEGALNLIQELHEKFDLYILTNGVSTTQYRRLEDSGLRPYFKNVFVSEDTGYQKPMPEYFSYVFERIPNFEKNETIIIGDSLTSDIKGGNLAGITTCWYNPGGTIAGQEDQPTLEIRKLEEILILLNVTSTVH